MTGTPGMAFLFRPILLARAPSTFVAWEPKPHLYTKCAG